MSANLIFNFVEVTGGGSTHDSNAFKATKLNKQLTKIYNAIENINNFQLLETSDFHMNCLKFESRHFVVDGTFSDDIFVLKPYQQNQLIFPHQRL